MSDGNCPPFGNVIDEKKRAQKMNKKENELFDKFWTDEENEQLFSALRKHGKNFALVHAEVPTKSFESVRAKIYAVKTLMKSNSQKYAALADLKPILEEKKTLKQMPGIQGYESLHTH